MALKKFGNLEIQQEATRLHSKPIFVTIARSLLVVILLLTFLGLTGGGYIGNATLRSKDNSLVISYPRIGRFQISDSLKITIGPNIQQRHLTIWFESHYLQNTSIKQILPQPANSYVLGDKYFYTFLIAPSNKPITITFEIEPQKRGLFGIHMGIKNLYDVYYQQFICP